MNTEQTSENIFAYINISVYFLYKQKNVFLLAT